MSESKWGRWAYCDQALFLARTGVPGSPSSAKRMLEGARIHRDQGCRADRACGAGALERFLRVGAAVCALLLLILRLAGQ